MEEIHPADPNQFGGFFVFMGKNGLAEGCNSGQKTGADISLAE